MTELAINCRHHGEKRLVADPTNAAIHMCIECLRDERVRDGKCACGCGGSLAGRARNVRYFSTAHRQTARREDLRALAEAAGLPASLSLKSIRAASGTANRRRDAENGGDVATAVRAKPRKPSLRISYRKAVDQVSELIQDFQVYGHQLTDGTVESARALAEARLRGLLTDAQRAAL